MRKIFPKPILAFITIMLVIGSIYWIESTKVRPSGNTTSGDTSIDVETVARNNQRSDKKGQSSVCSGRPAQKIVAPAGFVNTDGEPVTIEQYIGRKVILVDFMTYSCINCQRTFPYINAWYEKYKNSGLQIIGIHTPEFEFEKEKDNVEQAATKFGIKYPLVLDNKYGTWRAYDNHYWPHKYIIDINGCIVYDHIGEGGYAETEKEIQKLLKERNKKLNINAAIAGGIVNPEAVISASGTRTGEIYFGANRNGQYLGNGNSSETGIQNLTKPKGIKPDRLYLDGKWDIKDEFAEAKEAGASIILKYKAKDVYSVMAAPEGSEITIYQDGRMIKKIKVKEDRLYNIIENQGAEEHLLRITIDKPGLQAFTFTFG